MTVAGGHAPSPASEKAALRGYFKAAIGALDPRTRRAEEDQLVRKFSSLPGLAEAGTILLFVASLPEEPPTNELFVQAYEMNKIVLCPRVDRKRRKLSLHRVMDLGADLSPGSLGIPEPRAGLPEVAAITVDWALVPGLAFDARGFRLGRGGGFYDRLLPSFRPDTICWALGLTCQLVSRLPVESHDVPLTGVTTPEYEIRGGRMRQSF